MCCHPGTFTDDTPECHACDGPTEYMGTLGSLDYWRCRDCGVDHWTPACPDKEDRDEQRRRRASVMRSIALEGATTALARG
jgi:tRNA(Ile2) C34 agmatinyltransferase TiaS